MYYHGTDKDSAEAIVLTQKMQPSEGNNHWLGDGYYFYADAEYAFRWILMKYTNNFRNEFTDDYSKVFDDYSILSAELNIEVERVFSMENVKHKMLFLETKNALLNKAQESKQYKDLIERYGIVDGVVFNYLFKYQDLGNKYDAVKAVFPISYVFDNSRIEYLPEPQICVKNVKVISDYQNYSQEIALDNYKEFMIKYNQIKTSLKSKNLSKYKKKTKRIKYKKEELTI